MTMRRRPLIAGFLALLSVPQVAFPQATGKFWRIGVLSGSVPIEGLRSFLVPLLNPLGYAEGRNLTMNIKFAEGKSELLSALAKELVASKPDLLVGVLNPEILALKRATTTIPIVMLFAAAPVELGMIASLARPGGNITGTANNTPELVGKSFQTFLEAVPRVSRLTSLYQRNYPGTDLFEKWVDQAVKALALRHTVLDGRNLNDLDLALAAMARDRPDAISVANTGVLVEHIGKVLEFAARHKLPTLHPGPGPVRQGGLMSYGPDYSATGQRMALMIDKIFRGAKPGDIPVEEPSRFLLAINLKTAKALGITIPQSVLLRADEVIQ